MEVPSGRLWGALGCLGTECAVRILAVGCPWGASRVEEQGGEDECVCVCVEEKGSRRGTVEEGRLRMVS